MSHFNNRFRTKTLTVLGLLTALEIVLSRFLSVSAWNIKIGFSFVPIVIAALLFGPLPAAIVAALGDLIGALLFPIGPYFPGFTLTAFLTGLTFGFFLRQKRDALHTALAVLINQFIWGLLVNTYWISVLYGAPFGPLLATRVFQSALLSAVQFAAIRAMVKVPERFRGEAAL